MEKYTCTRCGATDEEAFENGGLHADKVLMWSRGFDGEVGGGNIRIDLCTKCLDEFDRWLYEDM